VPFFALPIIFDGTSHEYGGHEQHVLAERSAGDQLAGAVLPDCHAVKEHYIVTPGGRRWLATGGYFH